MGPCTYPEVENERIVRKSRAISNRVIRFGVVRSGTIPVGKRTIPSVPRRPFFTRNDAQPREENGRREFRRIADKVCGGVSGSPQIRSVSPFRGHRANPKNSVASFAFRLFFERAPRDFRFHPFTRFSVGYGQRSFTVLVKISLPDRTEPTSNLTRPRKFPRPRMGRVLVLPSRITAGFKEQAGSDV